MGGKIVKFILLLIIAVVIVLVTTFGWRSFRKTSKEVVKDKELVKRLKSHVYKLSHEIGDRSVFKHDKLTQAADYITEQFRDYGYNVQFQEYSLYNKSVKNIIVKKKSNKSTSSHVIIGAHYDTCFNPGADDNASAIAVLLELARVLINEKTNLNIKFIAFVNEEPPFFKTKHMGSYVYANNAKKQDSKIKAVLVLEMVGYYSDKLFSQKYPPLAGIFYPNRANFIMVVGNFASHWVVSKVKSKFRKKSKLPITSIIVPSFTPAINFSDHWSFWEKGYPAVMITDTAFFRYSHYHKDRDTYEKLNYKSMAALTDGLKYVLLELAK